METVPLPEKALIAELRCAATAPRHGSRRHFILTGIGDDCAVLRLPPGHEILVTTDFSLEGLHFRRDWHRPESIGHRCLARGLSDIAAMGGQPFAVFLSLALPSRLAQAWVRRFTAGLLEIAERYRVPLAGGDTAQSPSGILADIVVVGSVPKRRAVLRSGARPGDRIFVSGELGGSAAAILEMKKGSRLGVERSSYDRHFFPEPRVGLGQALRKRGLASAMIDTSDGLSTDLSHLCEESGVGAELFAHAIPRAHVGKGKLPVHLDLALHGGEDYELLFTVRPGRVVPKRIAGIPLTEIGRITRRQTMLLRSGDTTVQRLVPHGWQHFRR